MTKNYKSLSRTFRPQNFSEVTGQESIVTTLKNAIAKNKVSHAYLFTGIRGTGKTTLARIFAKAINCENLSEDFEPCNECSSCKEIASGQSLDVLEIDGASNRGIDDIRGLNESVGYASFKGRSKIFIIDEVHMLTKEAFNALLKTIEEPPKGVKFFLATTEPHKVPSTIISRCQRFDLNRIALSDIIKKLRHMAKSISINTDDEALGIIARMSEGSLRDAESLMDRLICLSPEKISIESVASVTGGISKSDFFALDEAYASDNVSFAFDLSQKFFQHGTDFDVILDFLMEHYRDIAKLQINSTKLKGSFFTKEELDGYTKAVSIYSKESVMQILNYLATHYQYGARPLSKRIHIEMLLLHIIQERKRVTIESILSHLDSTTHAPPTRSESKEFPREILTSKLPSLEIESPEKLTAELLKQESTLSTPNNEPTPKTSTKSKPSVQNDTLVQFAHIEIGGSLSR